MMKSGGPPQITVCSPAVFPYLMEIHGNKFFGTYGVLINEYIEVISKIFNATVKLEEEKDGIGDRINNSDFYNGCLGKMQSGQADIIASGMNYPLDVVNVSQGLIFLDEKTSFVGAFERPVANKPADFARSVYAFDWSVYLLIVVYLIMFTIFFRIRRIVIIRLFASCSRAKRWNNCQREKARKALLKKIKNQIKSPTLCDVIRHYIRSNFMQPGSIYSRVLVITIGSFSFITFACLNSRLNTELVIPTKVNIYDTYDQIMQAGVRPMFLKGTSYFQDFKNAKDGFQAKKLWHWAEEKFGSNQLLVEFNTAKFQSYAAQVVLGESLVFIGEFLGKNSKMVLCDLLDRENADSLLNIKRFGRHVKDIQLYIRSDRSARSLIKSMIIGNRVTNSKGQMELIRKIFSMAFEKGLIQAVLQKVNNIKISSLFAANLLGPLMPERRESRFICKENNAPVAKAPKINHLRLLNFKFSSLALLTLLFFSVARLSFEIGSFSQVKGKRRK